MAKTGKDYFDEIATIYSISEQSVMNHVDDKEKIQHIAACAALLAVRLCKNWGLNPIDAAPHIPYWLWLIINNPNFFNIQFEQAPLPQGVKTENRPDGQRQGGIDYTSKENIHKVIDPLFLDELKEELADIKAAPPSVVKVRMLKEFQDKLADIKFLDPAAGCGNFLVESYICLRKLENETLAEVKSLMKELQTVEESQ